jgi:Fibronectin type III domain
MPAATAVAPPTNLVGSATSTTTGSLSWGASGGASGYAIYYWNGFRAVLLGTVDSATTSVTFQGLVAGSTTYFAVVAYNNTSSAASNWIGLTTPVSSAATAADAVFAQSITKNQYSWLD